MPAQNERARPDRCLDFRGGSGAVLMESESIRHLWREESGSVEFRQRRIRGISLAAASAGVTYTQRMSSRESVTLPEDILRGISTEEIADLPIGRYQGDVRLVSSEQDFEDARNDFLRERWVGFDTETRPSFKKGDVHLPCMIQAATERAVYLFRIRPDSDFRVPAELIASQEALKVGVGLAYDMRALKRLHPFDERGTLDLGDLARQCGLKQTGVRSLAGIFLKLRIPKVTKTSNWAAPRLTSAQIQYAATDAWICRELFLRFKSLGMIRPDPFPA